ncbi:MAG: 16S rRNA (guanine(527)-N(7))-methyltransferase RsmG [Candidatus Aerophobetes bacterium]|nr:16S rRNA (guanine(527)-N(7))-methyltransferase RsmG [Candidatus Aerophobetes bacterium]
MRVEERKRLEEILQKGGKELGIIFSLSQMKDFCIYLEELKRWNERFNLTGIKKDEDIISKHFLDSLSCEMLMESFDSKMIDIGTGAGFPSLPLKIHRPQISPTLVDSNRNRIIFLNYLVSTLRLKGVRIVRSRAEDFAKCNERESYDYAVCRALTKLRVTLEYSFPFLKVGGYLIAQKGSTAEEEIRESRKALSILGGEVKQIIHFNLPITGEGRVLVKIKKVESTPLKYPRRAGVPLKRAL